MATVLVVDDDRDTCEIVSLHLRRGGYDVICASNGWEALLAVENQPIDLILLDVMMPGLDGEKFLEILRGAQKRKDTVVVVVTGLGKDQIQPRMHRLGIADVVRKTSEFYQQLLHVVRSHLAPKRERSRSSAVAN